MRESCEDLVGGYETNHCWAWRNEGCGRLRVRGRMVGREGRRGEKLRVKG